MADVTDAAVNAAMTAITTLKNQRDDARVLATTETARADANGIEAATQASRADGLNTQLQSLVDFIGTIDLV